MPMLQQTPLAWAKSTIEAIAWPLLVAGAFWAGRWATQIEHRLEKAENNLDVLVTRHMPAVHRALSEIRGLITTMRSK